MQNLIQRYRKRLSNVDTRFVRSLMYEINWESNLIGIKGARGIGKTTLMLQYIKLYLKDNLDETLYISLDSIWLNNTSLYELVEQFEQQGGKYLFLDEIHKYEGWAQTIKNIYDNYPNLKIVFTGSSLLEILNSRADLSRRATVYFMQGFSLREFISIDSEIQFNKYSLEDIVENHGSIAEEILEKVKPLKYFKDYISYGYYPYYREAIDLYSMKMSEVINLILEIELPQLRKVENAYINKIKQLLVVIAQAVPFTPNVSNISNKLNINRITILGYLKYLEEAKLTINLYKDAKGISQLQKPSKIYLENTNLIYLLGKENTNKGNLRETFFANQVGFKNEIEYSEKADFLVNKKYLFEVGGKNKTFEQLRDATNGYVVSDDIEIGYKNQIPLWLFGFLY